MSDLNIDVNSLDNDFVLTIYVFVLIIYSDFNQKFHSFIKILDENFFVSQKIKSNSENINNKCWK